MSAAIASSNTAATSAPTTTTTSNESNSNNTTTITSPSTNDTTINDEWVAMLPGTNNNNSNNASNPDGMQVDNNYDTNPQASQQRSLSERLIDKGIALLWVLAAILVGYWANVPTVLFQKNGTSIISHSTRSNNNNMYVNENTENNGNNDGTATEDDNNDPQDDDNELLRPTAIRPLLHIVALLIGMNTVLVAYLTIYVPRVVAAASASSSSSSSSISKTKSMSEIWNVYCPRVIPLLTGSGLLAFVLTIRATWPVWGFLAPAVLSIEALGCLFALHFVPWL